MKNLKTKIYQIIDSFLTEAKDQNGNDRNLERLNQDRHLAAEAMEKLIYSIRDDLLAIADEGEYEDLRREICRYWEDNNL